MIDYGRYEFKGWEMGIELIKILVLLSLTGWLFFDNMVSVLFLLPVSFFLLKEGRKKKGEERLLNLREDFGEFLSSFSSSIRAGHTMEQALIIGENDLRRLYGKQDRPLLTELEWMEGQLGLKVPCDTLFHDLANRSGMEEIRSFAVVLQIGRRQGGNLVTIIRRTSEQLNRKIQVQMEIEQAIAGRMMEKKIMVAMPYVILFYLRLTNRDYIGLLFEDIYGNLFMTVCLAVLWAAKLCADRMTEVSV